MDVVVSNLTATAVLRRGTTSIPHLVLQDACFSLPARSFTVLAGPPGSGKSALLDRLAGRRGPGQQRGTISYGEEELKKVASVVASVLKEDVLCEQLTVKEHVAYAALFLQDPALSNEDREKSVEDVLSKLRLTDCASQVVGTPGSRGSLGLCERRRLSVAMALIGAPLFLMIDEPTDGLPEKSACGLLDDLSKVAKDQCTMLLCPSRPSEAVLSRFARIVLLDQGHVAYQGPVKGLRDVLLSVGFPLRPNLATGTGPVTLPEALIMIFEVPVNGAEEHKRRLAELRARIPKDQATGEGATGSELGGPCRPRAWRQVPTLISRTLKSVVRSRVRSFLHLGYLLVWSTIIGGTFFKLPNDQPGIRYRMFSMFSLAYLNFILALIGEMAEYRGDRASALREAGERWYHPMVFCVTKLLLDVCLHGFLPLAGLLGYLMLGLNGRWVAYLIFWLFCVLLSATGSAVGSVLAPFVTDSKRGLQLLVGAAGPQLLLSGLFIPVVKMRLPFRWLSFLSLNRYALQGLLLNEFSGCSGDAQCSSQHRYLSGDLCAASPCPFCCGAEDVQHPGDACPVISCDEALHSLGFDFGELWPEGASHTDMIAKNALVLVIGYVLFRLVGFASFMRAYRRTSRRY